MVMGECKTSDKPQLDPVAATLELFPQARDEAFWREAVTAPPPPLPPQSSRQCGFQKQKNTDTFLEKW